MGTPSEEPEQQEKPRFTDNDIKPYPHFPEQLNAGLIAFIQEETQRRGKEAIIEIDSPKGGLAWTTWGSEKIILQCPPKGLNGERYSTQTATYNPDGSRTQ